MKVVIESSGETIWMRDASTLEGVTSTEYVKDGTQQKIIAALEDALMQARGQAGSAEDVD